jgi:hypothetical protein
LGESPGNPIDTSREDFPVDVDQMHNATARRRKLRDAHPHRPRTNDSNFLHTQPLGFSG